MSAVNIGVTETMAYTAVVKAGTVAASTGAVHLLSGYDADVKGTFRLSFGFKGATYSTAEIDVQADATVFSSALLNATDGSSAFSATAATVAVELTANDQWNISFGGAALGGVIEPISRVFTPSELPEAKLTSERSGVSEYAGTYFAANLDLAAMSRGADVDVLRNLLLATSRLDGVSLADAGVDIAVVANSVSDSWTVTFSGNAVGQKIEVMRVMISAQTAPNAVLKQTQTGTTSQEKQTLVLDVNAGPIQIGYKGQFSDIIQSADLSSESLATVLENLSTIGTGNVTIESDNNGTFVVSFIGALLGKNVDALIVNAVNMVDLGLADGAIADLIKIKLASATEWSRTVKVDQTLAPDQRQGDLISYLTRAIGLLPSVGLGNIELVAVDGEEAKYYLKTSGGLVGKALPEIDFALARATDEPENYLKIGAANVIAYLGNQANGVSINNGNLALVIGREKPATEGVSSNQSGYALEVSGLAEINGFGGAIAMSADAILAINTLGRAIDQTVKTGLSTADAQLVFENGVDRRELTINQGSIEVSGLGAVSGVFKSCGYNRIT